MAKIIDGESRTLSEYLLLPNLTERNHVSENVDLSTPISRYRQGETPIKINIPFVSAIMQAVSDDSMSIALAKVGGLSFIFCSQSVDAQADMVKRVKKYKAGFVKSDSNLKPEASLEDAYNLYQRTGHSTIPITDNGTPFGKLLGILTSSDYKMEDMQKNIKVKEAMTPLSSLHVGQEGMSLKEANNLIWKHKLKSLPIIDSKGHLVSLVFRKDYTNHQTNPDELVDEQKRLRVGAGINTKDYKDRVPALVDAGVDILCIDSSDGFSEWQKECLVWIKSRYNNSVKVGAGNVVDAEAFYYLADSGADFIKVGVGGGSICITREQKGIGRGQASAIIDVAQARDEYFGRTGEYIPLCSDGSIVHDNNITMALALGADFVMMGRYFARFDESSTRKMWMNGNYVKEYWGEGSNRARNWQRYDQGYASNDGKLSFEEGVDCYVPYAGKMEDNLNITLSKIRSTFCNCGALTIEEMHKKARVTFISSLSLREGGSHDVYLKEFGMEPK